MNTKRSRSRSASRSDDEENDRRDKRRRSTFKEEKIMDFNDIVKSFKEMQENQQKTFEQLLLTMTSQQMQKDKQMEKDKEERKKVEDEKVEVEKAEEEGVEKEKVEEDGAEEEEIEEEKEKSRETDEEKEDKAESVTSEPALSGDHEEEKEWAKELMEKDGKSKELEGENKEGDLYDPASPAFDPKDLAPKATISTMQPPPPPPLKPPTKGSQEQTQGKSKEKKLAEGHPERKRFKVERDCIDPELKKKAAKELLGENKYNLMRSMRPYSEFAYKICIHYNLMNCWHVDVPAHQAAPRQDMKPVVYHHGCQDCLDVFGYIAGHPSGHRFCQIKNIYKRRGEK